MKIAVKKKTMRGVSELIVIIAILLISVVAVFAFRAWVASQQQRMSNIDMATASYSVQYTQPGNATISLLVRNNLPSSISVTNITVTLSNNTVLYAGANFTPTPNLSVSVPAKSDALITITLSNIGSGTPIRDINVEVMDPATGQRQWIKAVGG